jgi:FdhD protein
MVSPYIKKRMTRRHDAVIEEIEDYVAIEKKVRISVNGKEVISLYCTPLMIRELVVGLFLTEGILKGLFCAEKISIEYGEEIMVDIPAEGDVSTEGRVITSGCVGGMTFTGRIYSQEIKDDCVFDSGAIRALFKEFRQRAELFRLTGCVHGAALSDGREIFVFAEDIGRHNAVDKVIGYCILENIPFAGKMLLASGRLSSEMVSKCARWGLPVVASRAAPTDRAIEIAEKSGLTLIGFVRGERMNIYANAQRVK